MAYVSHPRLTLRASPHSGRKKDSTSRPCWAGESNFWFRCYRNPCWGSPARRFCFAAAPAAPGRRVAGSPAGYAAAFGCALVWSGYSVLNRRFAAVPGGMLVGVCAAVAIAGGLCHLLLEPVTVRPGLRQWFALAALGIGPTGLAFLGWDHATKHGHLALLGTISHAASVLSTSLLIAAGDALPSTSLLLSALLVVGGMIVATGLSLAGARR